MAYENKWVADTITSGWTNSFEPMDCTWPDMGSSSYIWTDGTDYYYSSDDKQYVFDTDSELWATKTWNGFYPTRGNCVWNHNGHVYYSRESDQYELNLSSGEWEAKTWNNHVPESGIYIWHHNNTTYYGGYATSKQWRLDDSTDTWEDITWNSSGDTTVIFGDRVWTDGVDTLFSNGLDSNKKWSAYVFNESYLKWTKKTYSGQLSGVSGLYGFNMWHFDGKTYHSGTYNYLQNDTNGVLNWNRTGWLPVTWMNRISGGQMHPERSNIFVCGDSCYWIKGTSSSYGPYKLQKSISSEVPRRESYPDLIETEALPGKWLGDRVRVTKAWQEKTWSGGIVNIWGYNVWTDGTDIYYSNNTYQWVLDKATSTWSQKTWNGLTSFDGCDVWTDGTDIYYSFDGSNYVLDKSTSTWTAKTWSGLSSFKGQHIWYDGDNVYYSYTTTQKVLDKTTGSWKNKLWSGCAYVNGLNVWKDGDTVYFSSGNDAQFVLNKATDTWEPKTWNGIPLGNLAGQRIWTDGTDIYFSDSSGAGQRILNRDTDTWEYTTWAYIIVSGLYVWSDGNNLYYSYGTNNFKFYRSTVITTPYRLRFTELQTSIPAKWFIDDDIPFYIRTPETLESKDYTDLWLTELDPDVPASDITFDPNYRYVKLEFDVNITVDRSSSPYVRATTDLPNAELECQRGYYWYQWDVRLAPATNVTSRLYAAEESATNVSDFMEHVDEYGGRVHTKESIGYVDLKMSPSNDEHSGNGDFDISNKIHSSVTNTSAYNEQLYDNYYRSQVAYTIYLNTSATGSSSSTVTVKLYYCFDENESGYEALLAAYPNHASPYSPEPATKVPFRDDFSDMIDSMAGPDLWFIDDDIPFRVQFPELKTSIPVEDAWLIDDDIPFRIQYPDLIESPGSPESWLQDKGWEPRRPWPKHRNIVLEVQTIEEIPDVDWTKSMKQDYEFYTVDPHTWFDDKKLDNIISCNITHDTTTDKRGNASITLAEAIPECYIRTYLVVTQGGRLYKICLGTFLYMTSSDSFDGMKHNITMTGYTPLVELEEQYPKLGYHVVGYTNRKYGYEAPMVTDEIRDIILENTRCEVESRVMINKPLLNDFVPGQNDNWLTVVNNILNASSLQSYILTVDEWGTIIIADAPTMDDIATAFIYNDDNSSILLPTLDTFDDIYGIPNVMEVLYVGDKNMPAIRVVVKNEDENSIVSIPRRGREIVRRYTINNIAAPLNDQSYAAVYAQVEAQAYKLLEAASTIQKTISYSHGYCDVKVGDMVMLNYTRAGMNNVRAKVTSQRISCKPGCQVDETAVYTKKLWNRGV